MLYFKDLNAPDRDYICSFNILVGVVIYLTEPCKHTHITIICSITNKCITTTDETIQQCCDEMDMCLKSAEKCLKT